MKLNKDSSRGQHRRTVWLRGSLVFFGMIAGVTAASGEGLDESVEFDIPAQGLDAALLDFSEQGKIQVVVSTDAVTGHETNGVEGEHTPRQALEHLLASTGLTYSTVGLETVAVSAAEITEDQGGDSDSKNLSPTPVLMAQNQTSPTQTTSSRSSEGGTSTVTGKMTDARTGANLKGAKVTIEETGQWTSTNELGEFRFVNVPTGSATLTVSYLGYAGQSTAIAVYGDGTSQNFALRGGSEIEEIVVFGQRSARALALNQERTAPNSTTVLSADLLGTFNGTTISEALRRAPGVAFEQDQNTGDGTNIILRGLEPDLNQVRLNGQRLLDGSGVGRSPDLGGILTESIESVTINKSLLPSQDSNGAGGLIEIETKAPLDRERHFASFGLEYGENGNDFGDEFLANATLSGIFGKDEIFGASISVAYRNREVTNVRYAADGSLPGPYLPLGDDGEPLTSTGAINPLTSFPFEAGVNDIYPTSFGASSTNSETETLSLTGALQKQFGSHTDLRLDVTLTEQDTVRYTGRTGIVSSVAYDLAPIDELGGELRGALVAEDVARSAGGFSAIVSGDGFPGAFGRSAQYNPDTKSTVLALNLRGDTSLDDWEFAYSAGYTESENERGESYSLGLSLDAYGQTGFFDAIIDRDGLSSEALANTTSDGRVVSIFAPLSSDAQSPFILPLFNDTGFSFYNSLDQASLSRLDVTGPRRGNGESFNVSANAKRNFESDFLKYIDVGFDYQDTEFFRSAKRFFWGDSSLRTRVNRNTPRYWFEVCSGDRNNCWGGRRLRYFAPV